MSGSVSILCEYHSREEGPKLLLSCSSCHAGFLQRIPKHGLSDDSHVHKAGTSGMTQPCLTWMNRGAPIVPTPLKTTSTRLPNTRSNRQMARLKKGQKSLSGASGMCQLCESAAFKPMAM